MVHNYLSCASITEILLKSISVTKEIDSLCSEQTDGFISFHGFCKICIFEESRSSHANHRHLFLIFNELKYTNSMGKIKIENIMYMYKYAHFAQYIAQKFFFILLPIKHC